ncbi:MAG: acetylornithine transaminase [Treponema sp.]|nr:acetylornithine transaminase [Treponema sp.]
MKSKIVNNYASFDVTFTHGKGATLTDSTGKTYIDFLSGIGVNSLGHAHPALVQALQAQVARQLHVSNYYLSDEGNAFADELLAATGYSGGYFANSGAEANEAAIKLARKYGWMTGGERRRTICTLAHSFHGRTIATLAATGQEVFHPDCFAPYPAGFKTIRANDWDALRTAFDDTTAAFFMECIQGEGGVNLVDAAWARAAAARAREAGALVMVDEVQTGMGRTGTLLASDTFGIAPDVVTLAKGIAGGMPMGACLFRTAADDVFSAGDHQSTFAGNPLACCAGRIVLRELQSPGFLTRVRTTGEYIRTTIAAWHNPLVTDVRGAGLMIGVAISPRVSPAAVKQQCLTSGLLVSTAGTDVVRFLPPLTITDDEVACGLSRFKEALTLCAG